MNAIECSGVRLALGGRTVLSGVDLTVGATEFVGVIGANGAGKTTLMRAVLGLLRPASGTLKVLGTPARRGNPAIGYVPQMRNAQFGLRLSGWDYVAGVVDGHRLGLPLHGAAARAEVDRALGLVGATGLARRALSDMSGGERQRLLLAQALVGRPRLLLMDEPLASLDPHHQAAIVDLAGGVGRELGIAVLFSAHDLNPLLGALDRVLYLGGGRAALGSVADVVTGPALSRLYGAAIEVAHVGGRVFVLPAARDA